MSHLVLGKYMKYKLSIIIPARNEIFVGQTVKDLLENIEGDTEVIVVLDGYTIPVPEIPKDDRVRIIENKEALGQRGATNQAVRTSKAKYIMKVDAHCSFDKGFDVKMMKDMNDNWTMVPVMRNLHAFDWVCKCGHREYQGKSHPCPKCGKEMKREIVWVGKTNPQSTSFRFDNTLHFQYWREYKKKQIGDLVETMSIQGSCFMLTRDKYWELDICDEGHGSWGQQGVEVACKTWLSGGRVIVNKKTWYAHMFRTQGGDFGFPYPNPGVNKAREYSRNLWINGNWDKAIHPLSWLIKKFNPPGWDKSVGIIYYTDSGIDPKLMKIVQDQIKVGAGQNRIVSISLNKKIDFGTTRINMKGERGSLMLFKQVLKGLEALDTDIVFFCEHDVLYHPSHFDFIPPDKDTYYYNGNLWRLRLKDGFAVKYDHKSLSQLCANRETLLKEFRFRVEDVEKNGFHRGGYEPGTRSIRRGGFSDSRSEFFYSKEPNIDIRHEDNFTKSKWKPEDFRSQRSCRNWENGKLDDLWAKDLLKDF